MTNGRKVVVRGIEVDSSNTLTTRDKTYILTTSGIPTIPDNYTRSAHRVRILDIHRTSLMSVRIFATWDEVEKFADQWLEDLIRVNPTFGLSYTVETYQPKY